MALQVGAHLANHQADLGFVIDSIAAPGVSVSDLWATDFGCVMPHTHPLASKLYVVPADIEYETLICLNRQLPLGIQAVTRLRRCGRPVEDCNRGSATNSCRLLAATEGCATRTRGEVANSEIGAKSFLVL
ncbi:LysR substrate-binding domain-containing protein [Bradyrhizobium sp. LjRoot220]|uniref:LysR substrate-binding domain-containing protein n=1 Tax=Bradyrhizobium sp. LjRoot220 TaxID=3342284 RepID=UPI003F50D02C